MAITPATGRKHSFRPDNFELDPNDLLSDQLQYAWLGERIDNGLYPRDSSVNLRDPKQLRSAGSSFEILNNRYAAVMEQVIGSQWEPGVQYEERIFMDGSKPFTLAIWVWKATAYSTYYYVIGNSSGGRGLALGWTSDGQLFTHNFLAGNQVLQPQRWYHIAYTYDLSEIKFYIDGQLDNSTVAALPVSDVRILAVGAGNASAVCTDIKVADACVWWRALQANEIERLASPDPMIGGWVQERSAKQYWVVPEQITPSTGLTVIPATDRKLSERPDNFELDPGHTLARGLQFAGLGQNFNQLLYRDASNNRGDLNNYNGPQMLRRFGRPMLRYTDTLLQYTYNPSNEITLLEGSASIWFAQHAARNNAVFLGHGYESTQQFGIRSSSGSSTRFWINGNGVWKNGPTTVYDEFNHFCLVWDAVNWTLYYNGEPYFSEPHGETLTPRTDYVLLASQRPGDGSSGRYVSYTAGDAMIWDRPLTSDEVAILADPGNVSLGGLIQERKSAYWVIPSQADPVVDIQGTGTAIASGSGTLTDTPRPFEYTPEFQECRVGYAITPMTQVNLVSADQFTVQSGTFPTGISLNALTGEITGTPTANSDFSTLTIRATNTTTTDFEETTVTLKSRTPGTLSIPDDPVELSVGTQRDVYVWSDNNIFAPDSAYTWSPALPAWAIWNAERKRIRCTPDAAGSFGPYQLSDGTRTVDVNFTVTDPVNITTPIPFDIFYGTDPEDEAAAILVQTYLNKIAGSAVFDAPTPAPGPTPTGAIVVGTVPYSGWEIPAGVWNYHTKYISADNCFHMAGRYAKTTWNAVGLFLRQFLGCKFWGQEWEPDTDVASQSFTAGLWDETIPSSATIEVPQYEETITHVERVDLAWGEGAQDVYYKALSINDDLRTYEGGSHGVHQVMETYNCRYGNASIGWHDAYSMMTTGFAAPSGTPPFAQGEAVTFSGGGSGVYETYRNSRLILRSATRLPLDGETLTGASGTVDLTGDMKDQGLPALVTTQSVTGTFIPHEQLTLSPSGATARLAKHCRNGSYYIFLKDVVGTPTAGDTVTGSASAASCTLAGGVIPDGTIEPLFYRVAIDEGDPYTSPRAKGKMPCYTDPNAPYEMMSVYRHLIDVDGHDPEIMCLFLGHEDTSYSSQRCLCSRCEAMVDADPGGKVQSTNTPYLNTCSTAMKTVNPAAMVGGYGYQSNFSPSGLVAPAAQVVIRLAPIGVNTGTPACLYHGPQECSYNEPSHWNAMEQWKTHHASTGFIMDSWCYASNFSADFNLFSYLPLVKGSMKQYKDYYTCGCRGCYFQAVGGPFKPLALHCYTSIAREPWRDIEDIIEEFTSGYYGAAGPTVLASLTNMEDSGYGKDAHPNLHGDSWDKLVDTSQTWWTDELLVEITADHAAALAAVSGDSKLTSRVNQFYEPVLLTRTGTFTTTSDTAVIGEYIQTTHGGDPVVKREKDAEYSSAKLLNFALDSSRGNTVNEFSDGILDRHWPVRNAGAALITKTLHDVEITVTPEWYSMLYSLKKDGVELLHVGNRLQDGTVVQDGNSHRLWPIVPGSMCSPQRYDPDTDTYYHQADDGYPYYGNYWLRSLYGELVAEDATSVTCRYRFGVGNWGNSGGHSVVVDITYTLVAVDASHAKLQATYKMTQNPGTNDRWEDRAPAIETRWRTTDDPADSAWTPNPAGSSYTIHTSPGVDITDVFSGGLSLRAGSEFGEHHDPLALSHSAQAYFERADAVPDPGTLIANREITFVGTAVEPAVETYYWVNTSGDGLWNNANNWSATPTGTGGQGVPDNTVNAVFSTVNEDCIIDAPVDVKSLRTDGYTAHIDNSADHDLTFREGFTLGANGSDAISFTFGDKNTVTFGGSVLGQVANSINSINWSASNGNDAGWFVFTGTDETISGTYKFIYGKNGSRRVRFAANATYTYTGSYSAWRNSAPMVMEDTSSLTINAGLTWHIWPHDDADLTLGTGAIITGEGTFAQGTTNTSGVLANGGDISVATYYLNADNNTPLAPGNYTSPNMWVGPRAGSAATFAPTLDGTYVFGGLGISCDSASLEDNPTGDNAPINFFNGVRVNAQIKNHLKFAKFDATYSLKMGLGAGSTVTFNGTGDQSLDFTNIGGDNVGDDYDLADLVINKASGRLTVVGAGATYWTANTLAFSDGDLDFPAQQLTTASTVTVSAGARFHNGTDYSMNDGKIVPGGNLTLNGTSTSDYLHIRDLDFSVNAPNTGDAEYVSVYDSINDGDTDIVADNSVDAGGTNVGWLFAGADNIAADGLAIASGWGRLVNGQYIDGDGLAVSSGSADGVLEARLVSFPVCPFTLKDGDDWHYKGGGPVIPVNSDNWEQCGDSTHAVSSGTGAIGFPVPADGEGLAVSSGSGTLGYPVKMVAEGLAVSSGQLSLEAPVDLTAAGLAIASGQASIQTTENDITGVGRAISSGEAEMGYQIVIAGEGLAVSSGAGDLESKQVEIAGTGTAITSGQADFRPFTELEAIGRAVTTGEASIVAGSMGAGVGTAISSGQARLSDPLSTGLTGDVCVDFEPIHNLEVDIVGDRYDC